ncbi:mitochondrial ribosomal protein L27-domain-containing protein [Syncephalis pseudoplumigaleata]|uniref:Mitochondrial ribosomal protein L27-domain-containing protein n=1 Tax=Syncephalis pseudoplumigaleata TaxID=1712513 RepID=A0A4P9YUX3_9FUNG|nr:mitochondrial ribosomal protein L27-domain-containing protein [Syncephalis pseudoplumigaleata]|eukprot:RKP23654.1 mitochondrial ribosomal protein L27-domain-containing protein [Syncephalis pseudoplumigaleata]
MFQPTRAVLGALRKPMNTKRGHNYYKGTRTGSMGRHTKHGGYIIDYSKVRTYVVPDLADCELKPYVSHRTEKITSGIKPEDFTGEEAYQKKQT